MSLCQLIFAIFNFYMSEFTNQNLASIISEKNSYVLVKGIAYVSNLSYLVLYQYWFKKLIKQSSWSTDFSKEEMAPKNKLSF